MNTARTVFVDIETGGLDAESPIIEYAAIAVEAGTYREIDAIDCKVRFDMEKATT